MTKHSGSSFIEILISLFLLSLLLLGLDAVQITALRQAKSTYYFNVAIEQIKSMTERLRFAEKSDWQHQFEKWNQQNEEVLPRGKGTIEGRYPHYTLSISWETKIGKSECLRLTTHL